MVVVDGVNQAQDVGAGIEAGSVDVGDLGDRGEIKGVAQVPAKPADGCPCVGAHLGADSSHPLQRRAHLFFGDVGTDGYPDNVGDRDSLPFRR